VQKSRKKRALLSAASYGVSAPEKDESASLPGLLQKSFIKTYQSGRTTGGLSSFRIHTLF
jgi:hypothetical protein